MMGSTLTFTKINFNILDLVDSKLFTILVL
jgi:hypothetical protein